MQEKDTNKEQCEKDIRFVLMKAIGWYLTYKDITNQSQKTIAQQLNYSKSRISQLTISPKQSSEYTFQNYEALLTEHKKSLITLYTAKQICSILNTSIPAILSMYFLCNRSEDFISKLPNVEKFRHFSEILNEEHNTHSAQSEEIKVSSNWLDYEHSIITEVNNPKFRPWAGKLFCYFYSTNSEEIAQMQKGTMATSVSEKPVQIDSTNDDPLLAELQNLSTGEAVFCGIMQVDDTDDSKDGLCHVTLSFIPDIQCNKKPKVYRGILSLSKKTTAVFCELVGENLGDKAYFITDNPDFSSEDSKVSCCMAMVLTYSSRVNHRRPCAERMVISRVPIPTGTPEYEAMKANLKMNDKTIRIDEDGYAHLIGSIALADDPNLSEIRKMYPDFESLKRGYGKTEQILHIGEKDVRKLADRLNEEQYIIFERLLRVHSLAPFYCKTKATKAEELLRER